MDAERSEALPRKRHRTRWRAGSCAERSEALPRKRLRAMNMAVRAFGVRPWGGRDVPQGCGVRIRSSVTAWVRRILHAGPCGVRIRSLVTAWVRRIPVVAGPRHASSDERILHDAPRTPALPWKRRRGSAVEATPRKRSAKPVMGCRLAVPVPRQPVRGAGGFRHHRLGRASARCRPGCPVAQSSRWWRHRGRARCLGQDRRGDARRHQAQHRVGYGTRRREPRGWRRTAGPARPAPRGLPREPREPPCDLRDLRDLRVQRVLGGQD